jgi:hypothetical protein
MSMPADGVLALYPCYGISAVAGNALTHSFKVQQLNSSELRDGGASVRTSQQAGQA